MILPSIGCKWTNWLCIRIKSLNPLHPNISMHILLTVLYTFPKVLARRICPAIKRFFNWLSFHLFPRPKCLIQGWHWKEKFNAGHSQWLKGQRRAAKVIRRKKKNNLGIEKTHTVHMLKYVWENIRSANPKVVISTLRIQSAFSLSMNAMMNTSSFT